MEDDPDLANALDVSEFGANYRPLHYAAYGGFLHVCEALHAAGARALAPGDNGVTALFLAAQAGKPDVVRFLLGLVRCASLKCPWLSSACCRYCAGEIAWHDLTTLSASTRMSAVPNCNGTALEGRQCPQNGYDFVRFPVVGKYVPYSGGSKKWEGHDPFLFRCHYDSWV